MTDKKAVIEMLRFTVEQAKTYWDDLGEPYPEALQQAIEFLDKEESGDPNR